MAQARLNLYESNYNWFRHFKPLTGRAMRQVIGEVVYPDKLSDGVYREVSLENPVQGALASSEFGLELIVELAAGDQLTSNVRTLDGKSETEKQALKRQYDELAARLAAQFAQFVPTEVRWMVWIVAGNGTGFWESPEVDEPAPNTN